MNSTAGVVRPAHKAGVDKFAADMALELQDHHVAALSIWMGGVADDRLEMVIASDPTKLGHLERSTETPEFTGHVIWALYTDPALMTMSGETVIGAEMAVRYGFTDTTGRQPASCRDLHGIVPRVPHCYVVR